MNEHMSFEKICIRKSVLLFGALLMILAGGIMISGYISSTRTNLGSKASPPSGLDQKNAEIISKSNALAKQQAFEMYMESAAGKKAKQQADDACKDVETMYGTDIDASKDYCKASWQPWSECDAVDGVEFIKDNTPSGSCGGLFSGFFTKCCRQKGQLDKVEKHKNDYCKNDLQLAGGYCQVICSGTKTQNQNLGAASGKKCGEYDGGLSVLVKSTFHEGNCCTTDVSKMQ